jgi:hypothetical protein
LSSAFFLTQEKDAGNQGVIFHLKTCLCLLDPTPSTPTAVPFTGNPDEWLHG